MYCILCYDEISKQLERGIQYMYEQRIIIIAVKSPEQQDDRFESSLEELISLSKTAGGVVEKVMTQNRNRIHPATYIGEGKIDEIKQEIDALDIDLVISNDELSAGQLRNLGNRLDTPIIDRSQLILDIFAQRAKTKEGKLQVELAQLEYLLPRLHGQGLVMSRLRSEEHTSELQSRGHLVCRLLLEKKKTNKNKTTL